MVQIANSATHTGVNGENANHDKNATKKPTERRSKSAADQLGAVFGQKSDELTPCEVEAATVGTPQIEYGKRPAFTIDRVDQWVRPERRGFERRGVGGQVCRGCAALMSRHFEAAEG